MRIVLAAVAALLLPLFSRPVSACPDPQPLIRQIAFVGLRRISPETLRARIGSRLGQPLDPRQLTDDVRALARLEWFDAIRVETASDPDSCDVQRESGSRIVFRLEERPFLAGVEFRGSKALPADRIQTLLSEAKIALPVARPVNRLDLWRASRLLEHSLHDLGYPEAQARLRFEAVPTAATRAIFDISDGPRITAGRIAFSGVHAFSQASLRRQMTRVAPAALFSALRDKTIYTPGRLAEDLDRLENFYRDHGYPQARLGSPEVQLNQEPVRQGFLWLRPRTVPRFQIFIPVDEGPAFRFGAVRVEGDPVTAGQIERIAALPELRALQLGAPYSQARLERARDTVTQVLEQEWRRARNRPPASSPPAVESPSPQVEVVMHSDPAERAVRVTLRVRETHPYVVHRLEFSGQRRFSDRYYRRHIALHEGDAFDAEKIAAGLEQLSRAGYIRAPRREDLSVRLDETRHTADVAVRVAELGRQKISLVGGHAGLGSTAGIVYNVFDLLGGEDLLAVHLERGPDSLQAVLNVAQEAVFGTRVSLGLSAFQNIVRPNLPYAGRRRHLFTSRSSGLTLASTLPLSAEDTLGLSYSLTRVATRYYLPLPPDISGILSPSLVARATNSSLGWHWTHEAARDHLEAESSVSGGWLRSTQNQIRPSADYARLLPDPFTDKRNTWAIRGTFAAAASFHGDLAFHDRLFAGDDYLRGFRTGELAPYAAMAAHNASGSDTYHAQSSGADLVGAINAEYRVPVAPATEVAPFCDLGSSWLLPNWVGPQRPTLLPGTNGAWRASTGVELRWQIPHFGQTVRVHLSLNPMRLAQSLALPDGSRFHPPDRLFALGWALGSSF